MIFAGYIFATGSGGRGLLVEVICYLVAGATCFFAGINYIYEGAAGFSEKDAPVLPELEEVSPIQQQWRTIHITRSPLSHQIGSKQKAATAESVI